MTVAAERPALAVCRRGRSAVAFLAELTDANAVAWRSGATCRGMTGVMYPELRGSGRGGDYRPALERWRRQ